MRIEIILEVNDDDIRLELAPDTMKDIDRLLIADYLSGLSASTNPCADPDLLAEIVTCP